MWSLYQLYFQLLLVVFEVTFDEPIHYPLLRHLRMEWVEEEEDRLLLQIQSLDIVFLHILNLLIVVLLISH